MKIGRGGEGGEDREGRGVKIWRGGEGVKIGRGGGYVKIGRGGEGGGWTCLNHRKLVAFVLGEKLQAS